MYYVYILASIRRILYIGITNDIDRRLAEHRSRLHPNSFASQYKCDRLVHLEDFEDVGQAIDRESNSRAGVAARSSGSSSGTTLTGSISRRPPPRSLDKLGMTVGALVMTRGLHC